MVIDTESDRLLERKNPGKNESEKYTYDAVGNMIRREVVNATTGTKNRQVEYRYNYQDQLTSVSQNGQLVAEYGYDTSRQRVYAKTNVSPYKSEKYYTWSGGQIIAEGDTQGGDNIVRYVYSGNQKVAMVRKDKSGNEQVYYFVNNGQGTPVMIVNDAGAVVSRITVDEWGNPSPVEYGNMNEVNYTGKKYEPATGLYYFNQRYYDPRIGRFLTEDPAGQAFNPYLYAANNPLVYVDPDGLWGWLVGALIGAYIGGNGKDLLKLETWRDIAFGAAIGAAVGAGLDWGAAQLGVNVNVGINLQYAGFEANITLFSTNGVNSAAGFGFAGGAVGAAGFASLLPEPPGRLVYPTFPQVYSSFDEYLRDSYGDQYRPNMPILACNGCEDMYWPQGNDGWYDSRSEDSPYENMEKAKELIKKYGPDMLGIAGSALQMVPHPGARIAGKAMAYGGAAWGTYNTVQHPTPSSTYFAILGWMPPYTPIFGITRGSASLLNTIGNQ